MLNLTQSEVAAYVNEHLPELKAHSSGGWRGPCPDPSHPGDGSDNNCVMSEDGQYLCHSHNCSGNLFTLHEKLSGLVGNDSARDLFETVGRPVNSSGSSKKETGRAVFTYVDADGKPLRRSVRVDRAGKKIIWQETPTPNGEWVKGAPPGTPNVPYRLPELLKGIKDGRQIFWTEGEKNTDDLRKLGLVATTGIGGAKNLEKSFERDLADHFNGAMVVNIFYDFDDPGRRVAATVASAMKKRGIPYRVVSVAGTGTDVPAGYDVSDYLVNHSADDLKALADKSPRNPDLSACFVDPKSPMSGPMTVAELSSFRFSERAEEKPCVIDRLLIEGGLYGFIGPSEAGKSLFATAMAWSVSQGVIFAGLKTSKRPSLILDAGENGEWGIRHRFKMTKIPNFTNDFMIWGDWNRQPPPKFPAPAKSSAGPLEVMKWIDGCTVKPLLVIDSLSGYLPPGTNENDSREMGELLEKFREFTRRGATVCILHNVGKDESKGARGTSAIRDKVDCMWLLDAVMDTNRKLTHINFKNPPGLGKLRIRNENSLVNPFSLRFEEKSGQFELADVEPQNEGVYAALLTRHKGCTSAEFQDLAQKAGYPPSTARQFLETQEKLGNVRRESRETGRKGKPAYMYWYVSPEQRGAQAEIF